MKLAPLRTEKKAGRKQEESRKKADWLDGEDRA
jgi:hypothetical protein